MSSTSPPPQVGPLQEVCTRWEEAPEEDRNKLPSQLSEDVLKQMFRLAEPTGSGGYFFQYGSCRRVMRNEVENGQSIDTQNGYVRCSHVMHWDCIQRSGLDNGCPVCPTQIAGFQTRFPNRDQDFVGDGMECLMCRDVLTRRAQIAVLPCNHGIHQDCIPLGGLVARCPKCSLSVPTYGCWREVSLPSKSPPDWNWPDDDNIGGNQPPQGADNNAGGTPPTGASNNIGGTPPIGASNNTGGTPSVGASNNIGGTPPVGANNNIGRTPPAGANNNIGGTPPPGGNNNAGGNPPLGGNNNPGGNPP